MKKFVGRETDLETLDQQLQQAETVAISAILGMGGIGKTELALQYALQQQALHTYPGGICWLKAREDLGSQVIKFARSHLDLSVPEDREFAERVAWCWQHWPGGATLLILDDVQRYEDIKPWLPPARSQFKLLLTTRSRFGPPVSNVEIKVLSEVQSLDLLRSLVPDGRIDDELATAEQVCDWLGYLPLGLELVGRYLAQKPGVTVTTLWQRLQAQKLAARALLQAEPGMTASLTVTAAFELSWQVLSPEAQELAALLSLFALADIPWAWVQAAWPEVDEEDLEDWRDRELVGLSLLEPQDQERYQLHQLLREFFAAKWQEQPDWAAMETVVWDALLAEADRSRNRPDRSLLEETTLVMPHLQAAIDRQEQAGEAIEVASSSYWLASLYEAQGRYSEAEPCYLRNLSICEQQSGSNHPVTATSLNNLAELYRKQGRYVEAETLYTRAIDIEKQQLGSGHPATATCLNNLALLYQSQGRYVEAEPLYLQALAIREQRLGDKHHDVAQSLNNLAYFYYLQGRYAEAEPLHIRSLEIREEAWGTDHPATAISLNNLALLYQAQGRYAEAEPMYLRSLSIRKQQLGSSHPAVATSFNNLAELYRTQGRYTEAEPLFFQALLIRKQILGKNHPTVANCLNNLASLYYTQGRYSDAKPLFLRSLSIREQQLGEQHPDVANSLNSLAGLYYAQGRYGEAKPLYVRALAILFKTLGDDHPHTQTGLNNFIGLLRQAITAGKAGELSDHPLTQVGLQQLQAESTDGD